MVFILESLNVQDTLLKQEIENCMKINIVQPVKGIGIFFAIEAHTFIHEIDIIIQCCLVGFHFSGIAELNCFFEHILEHTNYPLLGLFYRTNKCTFEEKRGIVSSRSSDLFFPHLKVLFSQVGIFTKFLNSMIFKYFEFL